MSRRGNIAGMVAAGIAACAPLAVGAAKPVTCTEATLTRPFEAFVYADNQGSQNDPAVACDLVENNLCAKESDGRAGPRQGSAISICRLILEEMKTAAQRYMDQVKDPYCTGFATLYSTCNGSQASLFTCHGTEDRGRESAERAIAEQLVRSRELVVGYLPNLNAKRARFAADATKLAAHQALDCARDFNGQALSDAQYSQVITRSGGGKSPLERKLDNVKLQMHAFVDAVDGALRTHHTHQSRFHALAASADKNARGIGAGGPQANGKTGGDKSDVTGTDKDSQGPQQSGSSGGGGSGGGSGGGQSSGGASLGGGTSSGEPGAAAAPGAASGTGTADNSRPDATGGSSSQRSAPLNPSAKPGSVAARAYASGGAPSLSVSGSGSGASNFRGASASQPSRSAAGASGGSATTGTGSSGAIPCSGKDCQALGPNRMFGGVGALGSGSPSAMGGIDAGSFGSLDAGLGLDGLLKDDKGKGNAALGGMANLDASMAGLEAGSQGDPAFAAQASGEIGAVDADLFARLHQFHVRAQKRGLIVGMTRKL